MAAELLKPLVRDMSSLSKDFVNSVELYQGTCSSPKQNEDVVIKNVRDLNGLVTLALIASAKRILV